MERKEDNPGRIKSLTELDELPLFFIVGRGRSGSTLLRSMLDAHPSVMIPLESRFVQYIYYNFPVRKHWTMATVLRALEALESGFEPLNLHMDSLLEQMEKNKSNLSLERVCKLIYLHSKSEFKKEEIRILGDKNPRYSLFIPQLIKLFPEAKFIHLVRDYRDNIVSVQRAGKLIKESGNPYFALGRWCLYNRQVLKYRRRDPGKFHRVHFEELLHDPGHVMKGICDFLGLDYRPEMLNYHDGMDRYFEKEDFKSLHPGLQSSIDTSKIGGWEHELPKRTALRCEVLGGRLPEKIGYPPQLRVSIFRRLGIKLIYFPLALMGQCRFILKILFYRCRIMMRMTYKILLWIK